MWKVVVERVAVVKLRMNQRCSDGAVSVEVQSCAYASEATDMIVASLRKIRMSLSKESFESKMISRFLAESMGVIDELSGSVILSVRLSVRKVPCKKCLR